MDTKALLGNRAVSGRVGYAGEAHAPASGTYRGVEVLPLNHWPVADGGRFDPRGLRNLFPLVAAALYEAGFALEGGPLSTWSN